MSTAAAAGLGALALFAILVADEFRSKWAAAKGKALKTSTLAEPFWYICQSDPAVERPDKEADEDQIKAFAETWRQYIDGVVDEPPLKGGLTPVKFQLRHIAGHREKAALMKAEETLGEYGAIIAAVSLTLIGAKDWYDDKGQRLAVEREFDRSTGLEHATDETLNKLTQAQLVELAVRAVEARDGSPL